MRVSGVILIMGIFWLVLNGADETVSSAQTSETTETHRVSVNGKFSYINVTAYRLADMLKSKDFLFINVHIPYEGEIEKTDLFIPYNEIERNLDKLPQNKDAKIVLYCKTDRMSNIAAVTLVKLGYRNVWNLEGGMAEWKLEGYNLLNKNR